MIKALIFMALFLGFWLWFFWPSLTNKNFWKALYVELNEEDGDG